MWAVAGAWKKQSQPCKWGCLCTMKCQGTAGSHVEFRPFGWWRTHSAFSLLLPRKENSSLNEVVQIWRTITQNRALTKGLAGMLTHCLRVNWEPCVTYTQWKYSRNSNTHTQTHTTETVICTNFLQKGKWKFSNHESCRIVLSWFFEETWFPCDIHNPTQNTLRWKGSTKISKLSSHPCTEQPQEPHHVPASIVPTILQLRQTWTCDHFPGEPIPTPQKPLGKGSFPDI